ncbi:MAG: pyridoxamine 5'-phosphate oxidase family protein [Acidimicrobiales bacterium]
MGRVHDGIDERLAAFLESQPVFFVATAPLDPDGLVNCSPKGNRGELKVIDRTRVAYLDQTGSGVETVAHVRDNGRITLMFCVFSGPPRIVRLHGTAVALTTGSPEFGPAAARFEGGAAVGVRSVIVTTVKRVSDSCGYGVPLMTFEAHRSAMGDWAERKGPEGIAAYWAEKNAKSLDGLPGLAHPHR